MTPERFAILNAALQRRQPDLTMIAENTRKTGNIAALMRTCDAVGVMQVHVVADQDIRRHHGISAGSRKWVSISRHVSVRDACEGLQSQGFSIFAAHQSRRAVDFRDIDYTKPAAVLLGGEVWGVSATAAALADAHITVPMLGMVSSLNVSVAAALVMYEAMRQRQAAGLYDRSRLNPETYTRLLFEWAYPRIARRCRQLGIEYPELSDNGDLLGNPFADTGVDGAARRTAIEEDIDGQSHMEQQANRRE